MSPADEKCDQVRLLNDEFRKAGPMASSEAQWLMTRGVLASGDDWLPDVVKAVQEFAEFTADNDPYGEHDFGSFELAGERLFWKIDYYNLALDAASPDPSDPEVTRRVLTIMLASEY